MSESGKARIRASFETAERRRELFLEWRTREENAASAVSVNSLEQPKGIPTATDGVEPQSIEEDSETIRAFIAKSFRSE